MTRQDVQNDTVGMDVVGQRLCACCFNGIETISQDGPEDIDRLPVAAGLTFQFALHSVNGRR